MMTVTQKANAAVKREAKKAEAEAIREARHAQLKADFERECKTPGGLHHDDPVWNPWHPYHTAVNELICQGLTTTDAIAQATSVSLEDLQAEADEAAQGLEDLAAWLEAQDWSEFAVSLAAQYRRKGSLSPKQEAAAFSMREKIEAKRAEKKATVTSLDISELRSGYYAVPEGTTRLKLQVSHGKPGTKWEGYTFVSDGAAYGQRTNYGMQKPGALYSGKVQEALKAILVDPRAAMEAYGRLVGECGACGRKLEDENSIAAGIGPICAMGW